MGRSREFTDSEESKVHKAAGGPNHYIPIVAAVIFKGLMEMYHDWKGDR